MDVPHFEEGVGLPLRGAGEFGDGSELGQGLLGPSGVEEDAPKPVGGLVDQGRLGVPVDEASKSGFGSPQVLPQVEVVSGKEEILRGIFSARECDLYLLKGRSGFCIFPKLLQRFGLPAHRPGHLEMGRVPFDEVLEGPDGFSIFTPFKMGFSQPKHGVREAVAGGEVDDKLPEFLRRIGIRGIVEEPLGELETGLFVLGALSHQGGEEAEGRKQDYRASAHSDRFHRALHKLH